METVELLRGARLLRAASLVAYFLRVRSYKRHVWGLFEVSCAPVEGGKLQISWVSRAKDPSRSPSQQALHRSRSASPAPASSLQ